MINIAKPQIGKEEVEAVNQVLNSGILAQGPKVRELEESFSAYIGTRHGIATSSGTTSLQVALAALDLKEGDEVITTPFTFIASANSIIYSGARPRFADIDEDTFNISPDSIQERISKKTKAIMPVHLYGNPCDMKAIMEIAEDHGLRVIEDACQAHGASVRKKKVGSFDTGCFSFYPTKNMTCGEGGIITTDDEEEAIFCKAYREHGSKKRYYHDFVGYNYRMTDIHASIGIAQLKKLDIFNDKRIENAQYYDAHIKHEGISLPKTEKGTKHVYHQYTLKISDGLRDKMADHLRSEGIGTGIYYPVPIHKQKAYIDIGYKDKLPVAERISDEVLSIPVHSALEKDELKQVTTAINRF